MSAFVGFQLFSMCSQRTKTLQNIWLKLWGCTCYRWKGEGWGKEGRGRVGSKNNLPFLQCHSQALWNRWSNTSIVHTPLPRSSFRLLLTMGIGPTCSENSLRTIKSFSNFGFFDPSFSAPGKGILASRDVLQAKRKLLQAWDAATSSPHNRRHCTADCTYTEIKVTWIAI